MSSVPMSRPGYEYSAGMGELNPLFLTFHALTWCVFINTDHLLLSEPCLCGTRVCRSQLLAQHLEPGWEPFLYPWIGTDRGRSALTTGNTLFYSYPKAIFCEVENHCFQCDD